MSLTLLRLRAQVSKKNLTRTEILALMPIPKYDDGRTKQSFKDETDIEKIMARFDVTGTISHLAKFGGVYADFSDFDFHEQNTRLAKGQQIFDALPAELRQEFNQSASDFFGYVNDPANINDLRKKLPALAQPGRQLPPVASPDADNEAALAAASAPESAPPSPTPAETAVKPAPVAPAT